MKTSVSPLGPLIPSVTDHSTLESTPAYQLPDARQEYSPVSSESIFSRRLSNLLMLFGMAPICAGKRTYCVLSPLAEIPGTFLTAGDLAKACAPRLYAIDPERVNDKETAPFQLFYEVFPVVGNTYRIIYYIGYPSEHLPIPFIGKLYDNLRPILYGSKEDYEAVVVDVDVCEHAFQRVCFETAHYTSDPKSYWQLRPSQLHQYVTYDFPVGSIESESPLSLVVVAWNGTVDRLEHAQHKGYGTQQPLYACAAPPLAFLDDETFAKTGMDLRVSWLREQNLLPQG